ncbi:MAG TPA: PRC-barrel domain-containing protein [Patescibacteria group bacterium]|nr:PRC-barrel domain-containing protein [Patescibacteria group bacterium]
MPLLSSRDLLGLNVETESGERLGNITDFDIDLDGQRISAYQVKSSKILGGLFRRSLLIRPEQVVAISAKAMIVADSAIKEQKPMVAKPQPL